MDVKKNLHGEFFRNICNQNVENYKWLVKGGLKRVIESLIMATQDQLIHKRYIKAKVNDREDMGCVARPQETISYPAPNCPERSIKYVVTELAVFCTAHSVRSMVLDRKKVLPLFTQQSFGK